MWRITSLSFLDFFVGGIWNIKAPNGQGQSAPTEFLVGQRDLVTFTD